MPSIAPPDCLLLADTLPISEKARIAALHFHGRQKYGAKPYVFHLEGAVAVLRWFGMASETREAATWLHDVIDDTLATAAGLKTLGIPDDVVGIVSAVSLEPGQSRKERNSATYPKIVALRDAVIVKLADRIANVEAPVSSMTAQYVKEHEEFRAALYRSEHCIDEMWRHLDLVIAGLSG